MQYRDFGKLDWKVSALGFGTMRLPTTDGNTRSNNVDEPQAIRMIRHAIDQGINYLDTAYIYHGGNSELLVGKALSDGYRSKVRIATKSPTWYIRTEDDFDRILNEQLGRLHTDHIDFYLLHGLNEKNWHDTVLGKNLLDRAERAISDGRIGHLGFSFHDAYKAFVEIVSGYDRWTFCQIQYNYMDVENQAGTRGLRLAAEKGLAVIVMEPLLGGRLANPPARIRRIFDESETKLAPVDLALQWIWDQPEVATVLSGMSSMEQVQANIASASQSRLHSLQRSDLDLIAKVRAHYRERTLIPCTKCSYCMPCPNGVDIPRNFELFNDAHMHEDFPEARFVYRTFVPEADRAANCIECQTCEELCPQKIPISEWMPKVAEALSTPTSA